MKVVLLLLALMFVAFYCYWIIAAVGAKKTIRVDRRGAIVRIVVVVTVFLLYTRTHLFARVALRTSMAHPLLPIAGLVLCLLGFALAIWARVHLGRNWGMPMSLKAEPDLVTSGPYRVIRHPIYSGIMLAMLGAACVGGAPWLVAFVLTTPYFIYSALTEERMLVQQFPEQYPAYRQRTKALIPLIW